MIEAIKLSEIEWATGIYSEVPEETYHALPFISATGLGRISQSPQHFLAWKNEKQRETPALLLGRAIHEGVLQPSLFAKRWAGAPECDRRTKMGKETYEAFLHEHGDKKVLSAKDYGIVERIIDSVYSHKEASKWLSNGKAEQVLIWDDPEEKIRCKGRVDYLRDDGIIVDVKSTEDASAKGFPRSAINWRYYVQSAFYTNAASILKGKKFETYVMIAVEKEPPYAVAIYAFSDDMISFGRNQYQADLKVYAQCLKTDKWPAYEESLQIIEAPGYWK